MAPWCTGPPNRDGCAWRSRPGVFTPKSIPTKPARCLCLVITSLDGFGAAETGKVVFRALVIIVENPHLGCLFEILYYRSVSGKVNLDTVRFSEDFSQIMWDKVCEYERMAEAYPPKPCSLSQPLNPLPHYSSLN